MLRLIRYDKMELLCHFKVQVQEREDQLTVEKKREENLNIKIQF